MEDSKRNLIEEIIDHLKEDDVLANRIVEQLDDYNGWLNEERWYPMEHLGEFLDGTDPVDAILMVQNGQFNIHNDVFRQNVYGNLISANFYHYHDSIDFYLVEALSNYRRWCPAIESDRKLASLFDKLDEIESET